MFLPFQTPLWSTRSPILCTVIWEYCTLDSMVPALKKGRCHRIVTSNSKAGYRSSEKQIKPGIVRNCLRSLNKPSSYPQHPPTCSSPDLKPSPAPQAPSLEPWGRHLSLYQRFEVGGRRGRRKKDLPPLLKRRLAHFWPSHAYPPLISPAKRRVQLEKEWVHVRGSLVTPLFLWVLLVRSADRMATAVVERSNRILREAIKRSMLHKFNAAGPCCWNCPQGGAYGRVTEKKEGCVIELMVAFFLLRSLAADGAASSIRDFRHGWMMHAGVCSPESGNRGLLVPWKERVINAENCIEAVETWPCPLPWRCSPSTRYPLLAALDSIAEAI